MRILIFILTVFFGASYGAVFKIEMGSNNTFITGKIDILDRDSKLNINSHNIEKSFHLEINHSIPFLPDVQFDYIPYSYLITGKVELKLLDVLEQAELPIFFGTQNLISEDFKFGDFDLFDFFDDKDMVDMDIDVSIKEYNLTFFYQPLKNGKISPKYGLYIKHIRSEVRREIKTDIENIKDSSTGSKTVPFLFFGLDLNVPFPALNVLFKTDTEVRFLKYKETIYYNIEISETLYFTDVDYLRHIFLSIGYRYWRLKTDYEKDGYKVQQRLRWNIPYILIGLRF